MQLFHFGRRHHAPATTAPVIDTPFERRVRAIGGEILDAARSQSAGMLSKRFWSDQLMGWAMKDEAFKVQLFRFIDAFPALATPERVHEHLADYLGQPGVTLPPGLSIGLKAGSLAKGTLAKTVSSQVTAMARNFIAGADAASAVPVLRELWDDGVAFSVDLLGEAVVSEAEATAYAERYLDLVRTLPDAVRGWPANPVLERDHLGAVPRVNVSVKVSALSARVKPVAFEASLDALTEALLPVIRAAAERGAFVNFDMEQHALKGLTIALFQRCCERVDFHAGLAMQAYLTSGDADAGEMIAWAKRAGRRVTVRLIKGAYWDYETIHAEMMGWPAPVWPRKHETDACFERMARQFVESTPTRAGEGGVTLAVGTHNARSIACVLALLEARGLPPSAGEFQMLRGMADELKHALTGRGVRVREYVPIGQMIPGMAYLVRRLLENTSNEGWLRAGFADGADADRLLAPPHAAPAQRSSDGNGSVVHHSVATEEETAPAASPFANEPQRDFSDAAQRARFAAAVAAVRVPSVANTGTVDDATRAAERAHDAFPGWRDLPHERRTAVIRQAAATLRARRDDVAAVMVREAGKTWAEADADVCEAIDFCEFYARESGRLFAPQRLGHFAGELNEQWHQPRGVAAVIGPWNFPLAIPCGMTVAALVTGNATVLKPAEQTPGVAKVLCDALWDAGVPRDVLQLLPGPGETVGAALVRDRRVPLIAFTGSMGVGLQIVREAGQTPNGQGFVKRVVCEMGGKNAILVDSSADLDEAVLGVRQSAFSFAGQKCSACSRVIVLDDVHDLFLRRLVQATRALVVGDPSDPATDVGPLIDDEAAAKVARYVEIGRQEAALALAVEVPDEAALRARVGKPFVGPHVFSGVRPEHRLATDEIFGPVLGIMRAATFDAALAMANASPYKLTGGVFSRTPSHLDRARREFRVGNLYLNRGITGALVGRQPFGGFGMSGVGSKAGGADYLLQFVEPRVCTENTMRRGFAPTR